MYVCARDFNYAKLSWYEWPVLLARTKGLKELEGIKKACALACGLFLGYNYLCVVLNLLALL